MNWKDNFPKEHRYYETDNGILYNANCLDILSEMPDKSIDLVITSPPYDYLRSYDINIYELWNFNMFEKIAIELTRVLKYGGVIVWVVNDATINGSETGTSFKQALYFKEICGLNLHDTMIYAKNDPVPSNQNRYGQQFEYMFIFSKGKPKTFNPIKITCKYVGAQKNGTFRSFNGILRKKTFKVKENKIKYNIWFYDVGYNKSSTDKIAFHHPAIFPEQLAYDHIISWSNEADIVLDIFLGSGTTAKQCEILKRKWIGIEISEKYCEIAKQRVETEARQGKLF